MSAHTPGPWKAGACTVLAPETEDRLGLRVTVHGGNRDDNRANARLIAAAPDLLDALQAIIAACDRCGKDDDKSLVDEFTEDMEQAARAAIVKATGASGRAQRTNDNEGESDAAMSAAQAQPKDTTKGQA